MKPVDFILQLQGIAKVLKPDELPTLEQWNAIHEMLGETMKTLVAERIKELERKDKYDAWRQETLKFGQSPYGPTYGGTAVGGGITTFGTVTATASPVILKNNP